MPSEVEVDGIGAVARERLRHQAELQVRGDGCEPPLHELLEPDPPTETGPYRGFAALPAPCAGDVFLDLEGDPYAAEGGLEYLFGVRGSDRRRNGLPPVLGPQTALPRSRAFEEVIDFIVERRRRCPAMHVYHYAAYEPSAVRRLMGRHATREADVDDLLRGEVFIDLYHVLTGAVRLSTESYSLKDVARALYAARSGCDHGRGVEHRRLRGVPRRRRRRAPGRVGRLQRSRLRIPSRPADLARSTAL